MLDLSRVLAGPWCTQLLGDLGADVIKIESPGRGDYLRDMLGQITPHHSPAHIQVNRHKRSLTVDLTRAEGLEVFWRLFESADVEHGRAGNTRHSCRKRKAQRDRRQDQLAEVAQRIGKKRGEGAHHRQVDPLLPPPVREERVDDGRLVLDDRLSASRFWDTMREHGVTSIEELGRVLV